MRIMEIVSGGDINGAVVHCLELTRELANRGHSLTLVCRHDAWIGRQAFPENVRVVESELSPWTLRDVRRIAREIRQNQIDIVHTHQSRAHTFGILLRFFCSPKLVATAHNRKIQLHWCLNHHVIAVSEATANFHRRFNGCAKKRVSVIHCSIDRQRLSSTTADDRLAVRREFGLADFQPLISIIGSVSPRKGMLDLVEALPRILAIYPETRLLSVGDPMQSYKTTVMTRAVELGISQAIIWAGCRYDIPRILRATDLFVLPSLEEQIPIALLEAMAAGKPIVATNVGGVSECIRDGVDGLLVPSRSPEQLSRTVIALLDNPERCQSLSTNAIQRVEQEFCPIRQTNRIEEVFGQLIASKG